MDIDDVVFQYSLLVGIVGGAFLMMLSLNALARRVARGQ